MPITPELLKRIHTVWSSSPHAADKIMPWATFCLGFWGFLQAGKLICPSHAVLSSKMLMVDGVVIDSFEVHNDFLGVGFTHHFGYTGDELCL